MAKVPDQWEETIISENGMDPKEYGVILSDPDCLILLHYKTRDNVIIRQGDKPWPQRESKKGGFRP